MNSRTLIFVVVVGIMAVSCQKEVNKFERPQWLEGKLYTQLLTIPEIDSFIVCVERTGYDTLINSSGSYTVFAPDNEAFGRYLQAHSYSSVWDIPMSELLDIVKVHIIQNPWSKSQLQTLDVTGWINKRDPNNDEPWGYKRETLLKDPNRKYWVNIVLNNATIVDSTQGSSTRMVYSSSRKYLPLFFDEYMNIAEVTSNDYAFYFDRPYEPGNIYFSKAKLDQEDFFAENGFIYRIDEVVESLRNVEQLLENSPGGYQYSTYLNTLYLFPIFYENLEETFKQPGAELGLEVPTLYDLDYPRLVFDIHEELTGRTTIDVRNTIRYHNGMMAPTNEAMNDLINNVITDNSGYPHWANYENVPENVKQIVANAHMSENPVYESDMLKGFLNGEQDSVFIDPSDVVEKHYGSNATFVGLKKAVVPRAFTSVAGPVYLRPGYLTYMRAIEFSKILPAIKRPNAQYSFFVVPDEVIQFDSSLIIRPDPLQPRRFIVMSWNKGARLMERRTEFEMNLQMLNQVGTALPKGLARKEYIPNLAGNFIVFNNEPIKVSIGEGDSIEFMPPTVSGGVDNVFGYNGDSIIGVAPVELEEPTDNGVTYAAAGWFSFPRLDLYIALRNYPHFYALIDRAGLVDHIYSEFTFTTDSERYTVFVPSLRAIDNYRPVLDSMSTEELEKFVKHHFVPGTLIFTDGNSPSGDYESMRIDETSTIYNTVYTKVNINSTIDQIHLMDSEGGTIFTIDEKESENNIMTTVDISNDDDLENYVTNGVLHEIDTILIRY